MTEIIKENISQDGQAGQAQVKTERSEDRIKDLIDKLAEKDRIHSIEKEELLKKSSEYENAAKEAKFEADILKESSKYPKAAEFSKDIRSYVDKGLSVSEATTLVLSQKGELQTHDDVQRQQVDGTSMGGSAVTASPSVETDISKMSQQQKRDELIKRANGGEWGFNGSEMFVRK